MRRTLCTVVIAVSCATACKKDKVRSDAGALAAAPAPRPGPVVPTPTASGAGQVPLFAELAREASSRPAVALKAEAVLDALDKAGIAGTGRKQYLAKTVDAAYCLGTRTQGGLPIAVCEYASEAAARKGRETSLAQFPHVKREILVNRQTTLTLTLGMSREADAEANRASEIFSKM